MKRSLGCRGSKAVGLGSADEKVRIVRITSRMVGGGHRNVWDTHLWELLNFELWHRIYLVGEGV